VADEGIRVLIADDHTLFRDGLVALINRWDGFSVVGMAADGEEAVQLCESLSPDLVLMDVRMPRMGGVEATRLIKESYAKVRVVMLTMSAEEEDLFAALHNGARGYVLKDVGWARLRDFLSGVMNGEAAFSGSIAAKVLAEFDERTATGQTDHKRASDSGLTPREADILRLLVEGMSNAEIGQTLHLSEQTIKKDLGRVMDKMQVKNRVQAAVYGVRQGLVD
jgi:DNA-binding NarL/FixJ family response regulator